MNKKEQLEELLKKNYIFDNKSNDINGVMHLLRTEEDIEKMYNYIVKNNIKDTDDIYKYGFKLSGIDNQKIIIED
jgi:hypothetical protein